MNTDKGGHLRLFRPIELFAHSRLFRHMMLFAHLRLFRHITLFALSRFSPFHAFPLIESSLYKWKRDSAKETKTKMISVIFSPTMATNTVVFRQTEAIQSSLLNRTVYIILRPILRSIAILCENSSKHSLF